MSEALPKLPFSRLSEPEEILRACWEYFGPTAALSTSLQGAGLAALHISVKKGFQFPFFFLDTHFHFPETLQFIAEIEELLGVKIERLHPDLTPVQQQELLGSRLWERDPDQCCHLRKVLPLQRRLSSSTAWLTGIRKGQTARRDRQSPFEVVTLNALPEQQQVYKISPFLLWDGEQVKDYLDRENVPRHPLIEQGYFSIGCTHCTSPVGPNETERSGRWRGRSKTECGIHAIPSQPLEPAPLNPIKTNNIGI